MVYENQAICESISIQQIQLSITNCKVIFYVLLTMLVMMTKVYNLHIKHFKTSKLNLHPWTVNRFRIEYQIFTYYRMQRIL